ncbi:MAG: hypothetical protein EU550_03630 [Promethearchaeota archaeon]|nr:MAG: hypothetical protein EU550_03630 [Candidatus Lokiarchaeota archaeon]
MIKDAINMYESDLINRIEDSLNNKDIINPNQLKFYVKNLCSYMNRFKTDKPLKFILKNRVLIPIIIENFSISEREAKYEAFISLKKLIELDPTIIDEKILRKLYRMLFSPSKKVRDNIGRIFYKLFSKVDQITDKESRERIKSIKESQESKKDWILFVLYKYVFEKYPKIVDDSIIQNFNNIFLNTRKSNKLWDLYLVYEIIVEKYDRYLPLIAEDLMEGLESGSQIAKFVTLVYRLISEQSLRVIESIIEKLINLLIDDVKLKQDKALAALIMIIKDDPQILGSYKKKFLEFLEHSESRLKNEAKKILNNINESN